MKIDVKGKKIHAIVEGDKAHSEYYALKKCMAPSGNKNMSLDSRWDEKSIAEQVIRKYKKWGIPTEIKEVVMMGWTPQVTAWEVYYDKQKYEQVRQSIRTVAKGIFKNARSVTATSNHGDWVVQINTKNTYAAVKKGNEIIINV